GLAGRGAHEPGRDRGLHRDGGVVMQARTLPGLLAEHAKRHGDRVALREKRLGVWHEVTWREYFDHVRAVACRLRELGVKAGDHVAILSDNRSEWLYADLG